MSQPFVINREIVSVELSAIVTVEGTSNPSINLRENTLPNIKDEISYFCQSILDWDVNYSTRTLAAPISIGGDAGAIQAASGSGLTPAATESSLASGGLPLGRILISAGITAAAILLIVSALGGDQS